MSRFEPVLLVFVALTAGTSARAQGHVDTRALTCSALNALVRRLGDVVLVASDLGYETVHRDGRRCQLDETSLPTDEPTSDERACLAGWRCIRRSDDPA